MRGPGWHASTLGYLAGRFSSAVCGPTPIEWSSPLKPQAPGRCADYHQRDNSPSPRLPAHTQVYGATASPHQPALAECCRPLASPPRSNSQAWSDRRSTAQRQQRASDAARACTKSLASLLRRVKSGDSKSSSRLMSAFNASRRPKPAVPAPDASNSIHRCDGQHLDRIKQSGTVSELVYELVLEPL